MSRRLATLLAFLLVACPSLAAAATQDPEAPVATQQDPARDRAAVQARIDELERAAALGAEVKQAAIADLQSALQSLDAAAESDQRAAAFRRSIDEDPEAARQIRAELEAAAPALPIALPPTATAAAVRDERDKQQSALSAARDELGKLDERIQTLRTRPPAIQKEQQQAADDLARITAQLAETPADGASPIPVQARRTRLDARRYALTRRQQRLAQEMLAVPKQLERAQAERDRAERRVVAQSDVVAALERLLTERLRVEADAARERTAEEHAAAANQPPVVRDAAALNTKLSTQLTEAVAEERPAADARDLSAAQLDRVQKVHTRVRSQLEQSGLSGMSGAVLRKQRRGLTELLQDVRLSARH